MDRSHSAPSTVEDLPPLQAVAIRSDPAPLQLPSAGLQFGKAPLLNISRVGTLGSKAGLTRENSIGLSVQQEWNGISLTWDVKDLNLVPVDFPLERTHREINGADGPEVAKRISEAIQKLSIDAKFDGLKAKATCRTQDLVSFRIRLFAGGEGGLPVVVELQRRSGSGSSFMRSCRAILDAAEGKDVALEAVEGRKKLPPFMKGPVGGMKCLQHAILKADPVADMESGISKALELLRAKQRDSNLLGLENLCHITDAVKTRPDIATMAAKKVLLGDQGCVIREEVAVMLQQDVYAPEEFDEDAPTINLDKSWYLALVLFSNSLALTSKDGSLSGAVKSQSWFGDFLIPSLVDEIKGHASSANKAYEAACGLNSLASCSEVARRLMEENGAVNELKSAYKFGMQFHELLANESERCLKALGSSI
jgi:hypothetical protein